MAEVIIGFIFSVLVFIIASITWYAIVFKGGAQRMLDALDQLYGREFNRNRVRPIILKIHVTILLLFVLFGLCLTIKELIMALLSG